MAVSLKDAAVKEITVFNDRAEVTRELILPEAGLSPGTVELCVEGLTTKCDADSIRVKPAPGCTSLTIVEVAFEVHEKVLGSEDSDGKGSTEAKKAELRSLLSKKAALDAELQRIKEQRALVDGLVKAQLMPPGASAHPPVSDGERVESLLRFHLDKTQSCDAEALRVKAEREDVEAAVGVAQAALERLEAPMAKRTTKSRDVSVLVTVGDGAAKSADGVRMLLTYMVSGASWAPSYDIRVDTGSKTGAELSLSYFGLVVNNSGEDWDSCHLALSTAQPSKAGMPPAPPRRMLRWERDQPLLGSRGVSQLNRRGSGGGGGGGPCITSNMMMRSAVPMQACMMERNLSCDSLEVAGFVDEEEPMEAVATSSVLEGGGGTATFHIERQSPIAADAKPHKVTIAMLTFEPKLLYFATPALEQAFYLQVKARNSSSFPLLASSKVSVFLDGSFVTTTHLKDVSPSEEFTTFLGVDASLKLEHQQLARERKAGTWRSATQSTTHRYVVKLHNTKTVAARLTVVEVLPKSTEDKIKVELLAPPPKDLKEESATAPDAECVMQNKVSNNIVWHLTLPPGAKKTLAFEYSVSWPSDKQLGSYDYQG